MGSSRPQVVIVGAGFGGLSVARALASRPVDVTIVDRNNYHGFWPLLYQVATAGLSADDIAHSVRSILRDESNVKVWMASVDSVDLTGRQVELDDGRRLPYDYLVLAAGTVPADFGVPGVADHAFTLKSLPGALRLRDHVLRQFERAARDPSLVDAGALTVVIAGGGPTGVELAGSFVELFHVVLAKDYAGSGLGRARVVLVEMADHLLHGFSARSQEDARRVLETRGVEVRLSSVVASVTADGVHLKDGSFIPSATAVWVAGVRASPVADALGVEQGKSGQVTVLPDLSLPGHPEVFAIGDLAGSVGRKGQPLPQVAQVAMQGGRRAARNITARIKGRPTRPFHYKDKGIMATIGRRSAVAELPPGIRLGGTLGWMAWLFLHLLYVVGFRNRLAVFTSWAWNYVTWDRANRVIVGPDEQDWKPKF
jgi:NADH dehydrogenase